MNGTDLNVIASWSSVPIGGTLINVAAVLAGTAIGVAVGGRLPPGLQQRVLAGLGLVTAVIGVDLALAWRDDEPALRARRGPRSAA